METQDTNSMRKFTGYYSLSSDNGQLPQGAFLQIISMATQNNDFQINSISFSLDGKNVTVLNKSDFSIGRPGTNTIRIARIGRITLKKNNGGSISSLEGSINNVRVLGVNFFNPVPLEVFQGYYKDAFYKETPPAKDRLRIFKSIGKTKPLFEIKFDFGGEKLVRIEDYEYDPSMYLLSFKSPETKLKYSLMMGTNLNLGLASFVLVHDDPLKNQLLATIPQKKE